MNDRQLFSNARLAEMIHNSGVRPSAQRIAVLASIANHGSHPSADTIFSKIRQEYPSMSRTTVYNSLHALASAGLVRELEIESGNKRYDLAPQPPHSHFICRNCGKVIDIELPEGINTGNIHGLQIDSIDVYYKGLCGECSSGGTRNV